MIRVNIIHVVRRNCQVTSKIHVEQSSEAPLRIELCSSEFNTTIEINFKMYTVCVHQPWLVFTQVVYFGQTGIFSVAGLCGGKKTGEHGEPPLEKGKNQQQTIVGTGPE